MVKVMKASRLAELLMRTPDFDVRVSATIINDEKQHWEAGYIDYKTLEVTGIADIGYSDKVVLIDTK